MIVVEELKLNRFEACDCRDCQDLFRRVGSRVVPDFVDGQVANFNQNTMDAIDAAHQAFLSGLDDDSNNP